MIEAEKEEIVWGRLPLLSYDPQTGVDPNGAPTRHQQYNCVVRQYHRASADVLLHITS